MSLEQRLAKHKRRKKTSEERIAMRNAAKRRRKKTPEERIAMRKAIAVYHFRVTKIDTNQIVLEGLPQSLVLQSDFGKEYKETTSNSLRYFLEKKNQRRRDYPLDFGWC
ncbi:predicted protein [Chaetoceros tenuissimus]|uniref:Uncharacterized protein n=1 Tax=Chaetoceros tenuissimus TaxID=426638 RepID=A0AAD3D4M7_9STRA|nr:predicted protein [Chaetoceros tenuissimus]GFH57412.1 predicted protein [Chaetoceros tenuissimus]